MRRHHLVTLGLVSIALAAACGKKKDDEPAAPPAQPPAQPPEVPRPSQGMLPQLPAMELPADPQRDARAELGHLLFFDPRLSADGKKACFSCHPNDHGTGGAEPVAIGALDKKLTRHSPIMWNVGYQKSALYWDGRSKTLEDQAKAAWTGGNMGVAEDQLDEKVAELAKIPGYQAAMDKAFPGQKPTAALLISAISDYERTLVCNDTRYDRFARGEKAALDEAQQRGLDVFMSKGMCSVCHAPPQFSTSFASDVGAFFNVGIGTDKPEAEVDIGRMKVTNDPIDWAAFKPPTLRNISKSGPYFHDGSAATLPDAVAVMAGGGKKNKNLTTLMADRKLTEAETADLIAFLQALECPNQLDQPKLP